MSSSAATASGASGAGRAGGAATAHRLRADAARNRQALLDAAERLFAARGLAVTLDDIAAEAALNVATAYRHFANKHALVAASLDQKMDQAVAIAEQSASIDDPWEGLTVFLRRTLELMTANRALHDVFLPGQAAEWLDRLEQRLEPAVRGLLGRARLAGEVRPDLRPEDLGVVLQMLAVVDEIPSQDRQSLLERYLEVVLAGLRPDGGALPGSPPTRAELLSGPATVRGRCRPGR